MRSDLSKNILEEIGKVGVKGKWYGYSWVKLMVLKELVEKVRCVGMDV